MLLDIYTWLQMKENTLGPDTEDSTMQSNRI